MAFSDCHTHIDEFPTTEIPEVIQRASEANIGIIICAGTTIRSSQNCVDLSYKYRGVFAGVGLHPMNLESALNNETYHNLERMASDCPKVVCISEIGLDFLPTSPPKDIQCQAFRLQIGLARELRLPIILHSRESHSEVFSILREERAYEVGGIFHYFQQDEQAANEAAEMGFLISLAKPLLRLSDLQETVKSIPIENIVLETDSAPQPWKKYRHNWTEPFHIKMVADKVAAIKELPVDEVMNQTTTNLLKLIKLSPDLVEDHLSPIDIIEPKKIKER